MKNRVISVIATLIVGLSVICCAQNVGQTQPPFSIDITTPQQSYKSGSAIKLKITMTNTSDHEVKYTRAFTGRAPELESGFRLQIRDSEGHPVPETPLGLKLHGKDPNTPPFHGSVFSGVVTLKPGEKHVRDIPISKEYQLVKPGEYTITAERTDIQSYAVVTSNTITITITP